MCMCIGSVVDVLLECLRACNTDVRSSVLSNLVYAGEGSNLQGTHTNCNIMYL